MQQKFSMAHATQGMEIADEPTFGNGTETVATGDLIPSLGDGFEIVETVSGPVPGTFGLSDLWETRYSE